jgi:hypothetical protein
MKDNWHGGHTITRPTAHVVWVTKYRYRVLEVDIKSRCRDLLVQICDISTKAVLYSARLTDSFSAVANSAATRPVVPPMPQALVFFTKHENKIFSVVNNPLRGALYV